MPTSYSFRNPIGAPLRGVPPRDYSPTFGGVPRVPAPGASAATSISENIGNLGSLYNLGSSLNAFQNAQLRNSYEANLPGYGGLIASSSGNIQDLLHGKIPADVLSLIAQQGAERGIATGQIDSPNANAAYLRALGLTSLGLMEKGESELSGAIARTPVAQPLDLTRFFVSPEQQQEAEMAANVYASAPNPASAGGAGIGAFDSGLHAGGRAFPPSVDYRLGPAPGSSGDWAMQMYNAPWFSDIPNPPAVHGTDVITGTEPVSSEGYQRWLDLTRQFPGMTPAPYSPSSLDTDYTDMGLGEGLGGFTYTDEELAGF